MNATVSTQIPFKYAEVPPGLVERRLRRILTHFNPYGLDFGGVWLRKVFHAWRQPHRHFHTLSHLLDICEAVQERCGENMREAGELLLTALFHDAVWFPWGKKNEECSADAFDFMMGQMGNPVPAEARERVRATIIATKRQEGVSEMARLFHEFDCGVILHGDPVDLLAYEFQIFKEFQYLNMTEYRKGRSAFFTRFARKFPECRATMKFLVEFLERRRPRVGVYAGTFHPFHIGHLSILEKAEQMFDKVIVAVGVNPEKAGRGIDPGVDDVRHCLPFHEVVDFRGLMVDLLAQENRWSDVTLVRGLRNGYDLEYEMNQLCFMQEMRKDTQAVYIPCDKNLEHISSTALRSMSMFDVRGRDQMYYPKKYAYAQQGIEEIFR